MLRLLTPEIAAEHAALRQRNQPLALVLDGLARHVADAFGKDVVVTCIFRSREQQETVFGRGTKKVGPHVFWDADDVRDRTAPDRSIEEALESLRLRATPHMFWHAVDVRSRVYSPREILEIVEFLRGYDAHNRLPEIQAARSRTVWSHDAGTREPHLHIQYRGPPLLSIRRSGERSERHAL